MPKKRIIFALTLIMAVIALLSVLSCNSADPYSLWSNAMRQVKNSKSISADIEIDYGGENYKMSVQHDSDSSARMLDIALARNGSMKIISDGKTNYYDYSGIKYSSSFADDNPTIKKLLCFDLPNAETLSFSEDLFADANVKRESKTAIEVVVSGEDIKKAIAENENLEFSDVKLTAEFKWKKLVSLTIEGEIGGTEFYGLPIYKSGFNHRKSEFTARITNISYSGRSLRLIPGNISEYPDKPALALLNSAVWLRSLRRETESNIEGKMLYEMPKLKGEFKVTGTSTSSFKNEQLMTRTYVKLETWVNGQKITHSTDYFTDGKSDYIYYNHAGLDRCYKEAYEYAKGDAGLSGISALLREPSDLQRFYENAEISKSEKNTIFSAELNEEQIEELTERIHFFDDETDSDQSQNRKRPDRYVKAATVVLTVNEKGFLLKTRIDLTGTLDVYEIKKYLSPTSYGRCTSLSIESKLSNIYTDVTLLIPEGYEDYPEKSDET